MMRRRNAVAVILFVLTLAFAMLVAGGADYPSPDAAATGEAVYLWLTAEAATP